MFDYQIMGLRMWINDVVMAVYWWYSRFQDRLGQWGILMKR